MSENNKALKKRKNYRTTPPKSKQTDAKDLPDFIKNQNRTMEEFYNFIKEQNKESGKMMEDIKKYVNLITIKIEVAKEKLSTFSKDSIEYSNLDNYIGGLTDALITSDTIWDWMKKYKR